MENPHSSQPKLPTNKPPLSPRQDSIPQRYFSPDPNFNTPRNQQNPDNSQLASLRTPEKNFPLSSKPLNPETKQPSDQSESEGSYKESPHKSNILLPNPIPILRKKQGSSNKKEHKSPQ